jgi:hypothetical protein
MNAQTDDHSRTDGIVAVTGALVLLIGTATGNAILMAATCMFGFVVMLVGVRQRWGRTTWLIMMVSAAIAAVTAIAITILG